MRAYAARFVAESLVEQQPDHPLAVALCRKTADGLCSRCVHSGALCSTPGPTWLVEQFTPCCLPLTLAFLIGYRTLSQSQSLPIVRPRIPALVGFSSYRRHLSMSVADVGVPRRIALGRTSPTRANVCYCAVLTRVTTIPLSHWLSHFIALYAMLKPHRLTAVAPFRMVIVPI
jgi:hypothetical protein